jgi:hypothetical protein
MDRRALLVGRAEGSAPRLSRWVAAAATLLCAASLYAAGLGTAAPAAAADVAVLTHHYDVARTGWNDRETLLTPQSVGAGSGAGMFGPLATIALDGIVDAQPLIVPRLHVAGDPDAGTHDVVYVATEANTLFAIDPIAGKVLLSRNFGSDLTFARGCGAGDAGVGITGTPVIDLERNTLYLVAATRVSLPGGGSRPVHTLHALDPATLADKLPPVEITGSQTLKDGSVLTFVPNIERQRPALLESHGLIYTAFSSYCDGAGTSRGWLFAWSADTLAPLKSGPDGVPRGFLTNRLASAPSNRFLSSIWMSGAGPASDPDGIYVVTGNSDWSGATYDPVWNVEESVVRIAPSTEAVLDLFTPQNEVLLDNGDADFGAGGVVLLPASGAGQPPMAAAAGKAGILYLMDRSNLGGYTPGGPDMVLAQTKIGPCWCAPSYFDDGTPTLVSSGKNRIELWAVPSSPTTALVERFGSPVLSTGPDPGFFTTISSDHGGPPVIWAVTRPLSQLDARVWLYAFGLPKVGKLLTQLYAAPAGLWVETNHNASIVPVVANGRVYVASDAELAVFGLGASAAARAAIRPPPQPVGP